MSLDEEEINDDNIADNIEEELKILEKYLKKSDDAKLDITPEKMTEKYITTLDGKLKKIIIEKDKNIKKQVYKLMSDNNYSLTLGRLYSLFDIEEKSENRAIYLRRLFFQYIKEEM